MIADLAQCSSWSTTVRGVATSKLYKKDASHSGLRLSLTGLAVSFPHTTPVISGVDRIGFSGKTSAGASDGSCLSPANSGPRTFLPHRRLSSAAPGHIN